MIKLRHPTRSFAFKKPGEVFEVYDKDVDKYVNRYGCELVDNPRLPKPKPKPKPRTGIDVAEVLDKIDISPDEVDELRAEIADLPEVTPPVQSSPGWWSYEGKKYRKAKLPAEALALLE